MNLIDPGNSVWFHEHVEDAPCNPNCYAHVDSPASAYKPLRYFLHINGMLREVYPITKPSRDNRETVLVEVSRTGEVLRVGNGSLILHR